MSTVSSLSLQFAFPDLKQSFLLRGEVKLTGNKSLSQIFSFKLGRFADKQVLYYLTNDPVWNKKIGAV
jgi:hypothetical protein